MAGPPCTTCVSLPCNDRTGEGRDGNDRAEAGEQGGRESEQPGSSSLSGVQKRVWAGFIPTPSNVLLFRSRPPCLLLRN